jgi:hypothetical protein
MKFFGGFDSEFLGKGEVVSGDSEVLLISSSSYGLLLFHYVHTCVFHFLRHNLVVLI